MHPTGTGKRRIGTAGLEHEAKAEEEPEVLVALAEPAVQVELAELAVLVALAEPVVRVELAVRVASGELVVRVELAVQVASGEPVVRVELAAQVASGEPVVQVVAELEPVRAAVPVRARSVTVARHRGLVPVPRAEDLAAAAETTRERVVVEAARAWAAAE